MATPFLTDAAFWVTVCSMRLLEVGTRLSEPDAEQTAADLYEDPAYRSMSPVEAADAFRGQQTRVAA